MRKLSRVLVGVCSWAPERTYTLHGRVADDRMNKALGG
jgi:hypothetical protein